MTTPEKIWYELFPYVCLAAALIALLSRSGSGLVKVFALLLLLVSGAILAMRWLYRRQRL